VAHYSTLLVLYKRGFRFTVHY